MSDQRTIVSLLIENTSGSLSRVTGLFSQRGFNIESMNVAPTEETSLSRMTIVTDGDQKIISQILKQLNRIIDIYKVVNISSTPLVERELMLVKVSTETKSRDEVTRLVDIFRAKIIDVSSLSYIVEVSGDNGKLNAFLHALNPADIIEVVRTGRLGMSRGSRALKL